MNSLFLLLVLVCFIALILGMIKPRIIIRWGNVEKRNRKNVLKYYGIGLIVFFILFSVTSSNTGTMQKNTSSTLSTSTIASKDKNTAADKATAEKAAAEKAAADKISYDTGITYDQLARTPDNYKGKKVKLSGKVIQVIEGSTETDLRIAIDNNYHTILLVSYKPNITPTRVLENDNITIKGISKGLYTYNSTIGGKITLPLVLVNNITINQ